MMNVEYGGVLIVPVIIGLVEMGKRLGLSTAYAAPVAVGLGLLISIGYTATAEPSAEHARLADAVLRGLALGLSAAGLYSGFKGRGSEAEQPNPPTPFAKGKGEAVRLAIENGARGGDRGGGWGGPAALGAAQPDQRLARGPSTGWPGPCWPAAVVAARRGGWLAPGASAPGGARAGWAALLRQAQPGAPLAGGGRPERVACGARRDRTLLPT